MTLLKEIRLLNDVLLLLDEMHVKCEHINAISTEMKQSPDDTDTNDTVLQEILYNSFVGVLHASMLGIFFVNMSVWICSQPL